MAHIVIEGPDGFNQRVNLDRLVTLGRDDDCDVPLHNHAVSRQHVSISPGFLVKDLDSSNGTFFKGKQVRKAFLYAGETFNIGAKSAYSIHIVGQTFDLDPGPAKPERGLMTMTDDGPSFAGGLPSVSFEHVVDSKELADRLSRQNREVAELRKECEELRTKLTRQDASPPPGARPATTGSETT